MAFENNIIRRQTIDLQYNGKAGGFELQTQLSNWCNQDFLPALETALEEYASDDNYIKIDKIEIETSVTESGDWQAIILKTIIDKIKNEIDSVANNTTRSEAIQHQSKEGNFKEVLFYFLQNGYLPWWGTTYSNHEFNKRLEEWLHQAQHETIAEILPLLSRQTVAKRIVYQFTVKAFALLIAGLTKITQQNIEAIINDVSALSGTVSADKNISPASFKEAILNHLAGSSFPKNIMVTGLEVWIQRQIAEEGLVIKTIQNKTFYSIEFKSAVDAVRRKNDAVKKVKISKKKQPEESPFNDGIVKEEIQPEDEIIDNTPAAIENKETADTTKEKAVQPTKPIDKMLREEIYINNAGLVLLASFLPRFFENLGMIENGKFNSKDLAVAILQWLVTGKDDYAEFELVLPKILCGIELEESVIIIPRLPETFKAEGESLLQSVIEHWSILKNTSIEGLRQSFLQREGKLSMNSEGWFLQVEQKPFDMLLGYLPWNIDMIKLSWMPRMVKTEWIG